MHLPGSWVLRDTQTFTPPPSRLHETKALSAQAKRTVDDIKNKPSKYMGKEESARIVNVANRLNDNVAYYDDQVRAMTTQLERANSHIKKLNHDLSGLESTNWALAEQVENLEAEIDNLRQQLANLRTHDNATPPQDAHVPQSPSESGDEEDSATAAKDEKAGAAMGGE